MLRARQMRSGRETLPGLREALGLAEDGTAEGAARSFVQAMEDASWAPGEVGRVAARHVPGERREPVTRALEFAATEIVPRLARTPDEIVHVLHALDGGYVPAGPSGSPLRGLVNVLPTGRNFRSVDPCAVPSRLAWETG